MFQEFLANFLTMQIGIARLRNGLSASFRS
jgi:hypothetical protein